jgi:hypothetical protein
MQLFNQGCWNYKRKTRNSYGLRNAWKHFKAQIIVNNNSDTKGYEHGKRIVGMHRCIQGRFRKMFYARWLSDLLHFNEIEKA